MCSFEDLAVLGCRAVSLGNKCLHCEGSGDLNSSSQESGPLNVKALCSTEMSGTDYALVQYHTGEEVNLHNAHTSVHW